MNMNSRKIPLMRNYLLICCLVISAVFIAIFPNNVEATNEDNPPSKIYLDNVFITPESDSTSQIIDRNIVEVTSNTKEQKGAIWSTEENKMDLNEDFQASMYMYFGNQGKNAADGMAFVMHNDSRGTNTIGDYDGSSMGVWASSDAGSAKDSGITNSFAVEFDTYRNNSSSDGFFDNNNVADHVAWGLPGDERTYIEYHTSNSRRTILHSGVDGSSAQYTTSDLSNDTWRKFTVSWNAENQVLIYQLEGLDPVTVKFDGTQPYGADGYVGSVYDVFGSDEVYWGFAGSTGGKTQLNRIVFDEIPGLLNVNTDRTLTRADGSIVEKYSSVNSGEFLTYTIRADYVSGKQDWFNPILYGYINEHVKYVPNSLTINTVGDLEDNLWLDDRKLEIPASIIGDMSDDNNEIIVTFKVRVGTVLEDTVVTDAFAFYGDNYSGFVNAMVYEISANIAPEITVSDNGPIDIELAKKYTIQGSWSDLDSDYVDLYCAINDGVPVKFASEVANADVKGEEVSFEYEIDTDQISVATHKITIYAIDNTNVKSNEEIIILVVNGVLEFVDVPENMYFENTSIPSRPVISKRSEGWGIAVQDSRVGNNLWKVRATLSREFSNGDDQYLNGALLYVDANDNETIMELGKPVDVFEHTTTSVNKVFIGWTEEQGILLKVRPDFYAGEYNGAITWTLVDAP